MLNVEIKEAILNNDFDKIVSFFDNQEVSNKFVQELRKNEYSSFDIVEYSNTLVMNFILNNGKNLIKVYFINENGKLIENNDKVLYSEKLDFENILGKPYSSDNITEEDMFKIAKAILPNLPEEFTVEKIEFGKNI